MWQIWLIIAGLCFIIEMATVGFFVFWFGVGALVSMIVSIFAPDNIVLQCTVFVVTSVVLLFLTKPLVNKLTKKDKKVEMNSNSNIGKKGIVTQDINPVHGVGLVKVSGEVWSAKTEDGKQINKGTQIKVVGIEGVKLIVEPITSSKQAEVDNPLLANDNK